MKKKDNAYSKDCIFYVDNADCYLDANDAFIKALGLKSHQELIGRPGLDFAHPAYFQNYQQNNQYIKNHGAPSCFLEVVPDANDHRYFLVLKSPVIASDRVIAVKGQGILINDQPFDKIISSFVLAAEQCNYRFNIQSMIRIITQIKKYNQYANQSRDSKLFTYGKITFTMREAQCLHFLLKNYSADKTAARLGISRKTVEFHIANIKEKSACYNKSQITDKAIDEGFIDLMFMKFPNMES